jgi:hypothetical protein
VPAAGADQPDGLAGLLQRVLEQVGAGDELAVADEQVADLLAGALVGERPVASLFPQVDDLLESVGGVLVERDGPFLAGLAGREPKPWCPVGVAVQAVDGEPTDLIAAGT